MVFTERTETAAALNGPSHASAVSTPLRWIFNETRYKKLFTHVESYANAVSLLENSIKVINKQQQQSAWSMHMVGLPNKA